VTTVLQFVVLGLGLAAIYTLLAQGIVLVYRGSGVINFAHGAFALIGAIVYVETSGNGVPVVFALLFATLAGAALGVLVQNGILRQLQRASALTRIVATLGVLIIIQSAAGLHYGTRVQQVATFLPQNEWHIAGISVGADRVILYAVAVLVTAAISLAQRRWLFLLATRAAAENEEAATTLGWSSGRLATMNWAIGGAMAGIAGALIVPITGLLVATMVLLVVPALAAALLGRFDSVWLTLLGASGVGIAQSLITRYWTQTGAAEAVPFLVIIVVLVITGQTLPARAQVFDRLPSLGRGVIRPIPLLVGVAISLAGMLSFFSYEWQTAFTITFAVATILLSAVVVTGYAGQISLTQYALAGLGAFVSGRLVAAAEWPFWAAALAGVAACVPIGVLFALPALRTRGLNLAVVTLGMGVAVNAVIFSNIDYTGGANGTQFVNGISLFGIDLTSFDHPEAYGVFVVIMFTLVALVVANLRRSSTGRRLIAIRENERAAAALGVSVFGSKIYAFTLGAAIAALGGILLAFQSTAIVFSTFDPLQSIYAVCFTVIGGIGYVLGPFVGATFASGGAGTLINGLLSGINDYLVLIGGVMLIVVLILNPDGVVAATLEQLRIVRGWLGPWPERAAALWRRVLPSWLRGREIDDRALLEDARQGGDMLVKPATLQIEGLTVRFGGVVALDGVSLEVRPGEVVGLLGPNGAGKTTLIDAVTGFAPITEGTVAVDGRQLNKTSARSRVRAGIGRSWQSLELFEAISVRENLQIASESVSGRPVDALRNLIVPRRPSLNRWAAAAIAEFQLQDDLGRSPSDLSYGRRRLVAIARTVALSPGILLLDEPAAGLDDNESAELGALLRGLADRWGIAILLIEHDVDLVMNACDRIVVLDFGKKIAEDTPEGIRRNPAVISAYLGESEEADKHSTLV
jgi:sulfate-transporting ATPase